jgi:hypothetical protein
MLSPNSRSRCTGPGRLDAGPAVGLGAEERPPLAGLPAAIR